MNTYQKHILGLMEDVSTSLQHTPVVHFDYANRGTVVAMSGAQTLAVMHFDFQNDTVSMSLNTGKDQVDIGPRSPQRFWWRVGDLGAGAEVERMLEEWANAQ